MKYVKSEYLNDYIDEVLHGHKSKLQELTIEDLEIVIEGMGLDLEDDPAEYDSESYIYLDALLEKIKSIDLGKAEELKARIDVAVKALKDLAKEGKESGVPWTLINSSVKHIPTCFGWSASSLGC